MGRVSPTSPPLARRLAGEEYAAWEEALDLLPKLSVAGGRGELRRWLDGLPDFPCTALAPAEGAGGERQQWRALLVLSFLAHVSGS